MAENQAICRAPNFKDLTGEAFGYLRVIELSGKSRTGRILWKCICDAELGGCGTTTIVFGDALRGGHTKSCGCIRANRCAALKTTHGMAGTTEHSSWTAMIARCTRPANRAFNRYGGRGITVCDRWRDFANFFADMGPKPSPKHSLDRIDNDRGYEPGNVIWATPKTQSRNRRVARLFTIDGRTQCLSAWAEERGISVKTVRTRLERGIPIEAALLPIKSK